jgi:two-component system chemotaxis response regulator CheY
MISAIDQRDSLTDAIRNGATDYVVKPFEDDRMISTLKNIFGEDQKEAVGSRQ